MCNDDNEKRDTRIEAAGLCAKLDTLEMVFMAHFWDVILDRFHATSMHLQKSDIDISVAAQFLSLLRDFVAGQRDQFEAFERAALNVTGVSQ